MEEYFTVYKITNNINGRTYIGVHKTRNIDDGYMGSGKLIKRAIEKHGVGNFEKEILATFDNPDDMFSMESVLVDDVCIGSRDSYNMKVGGVGSWDYVNSSGLGGAALRMAEDPEFRERMRLISVRNGNMTKELGVGIHNPKYWGHWEGRTHTDTTKRKIGESNKGRGLGSTNSQYGKCWVFSEIKKVSIKIPKSELSSYISAGWEKGRKMKF